MFLSDEQTREIDRLWAEHRFITQYPVVENDYLPLFIGFVTQDQPKELLAYFEGNARAFRERAEEFERDFDGGRSRGNWHSCSDFAARAYRRPLAKARRPGIARLYESLREKGVAHDEAFRNVLARVLISPAFLFHIEQPPPGQAAAASQRLGTRQPAELLPVVVAARRGTAPTGRRRDNCTTESTWPNRRGGCSRTIASRRLAIEFGTQWIHVRGFDELQREERKAVPDVRRRLASGDVRGIDPVLPGSVPERPRRDGTFSMPTTRSSTKRWRSTTAFPA